MRFRFLRTAWLDIQKRKNLELYLVLVTIIVIFAADILGIANVTSLFEIILASLTVLIYGMIDGRQNHERLDKNVQNIANAMEQIPKKLEQNNRSLCEVQTKVNGIDDQITTLGINVEKVYKEIYKDPFFSKESDNYKKQTFSLKHDKTTKAIFWGLTFDKLLPQMRPEISDMLMSKHLEARFLILEPNSEAVRMAAFRHSDQVNEKFINSELELTIERLKTIADEVKVPSKFEVRTVGNYLPPWTIVAFFDNDLQYGEMYIGLLPFRSLDFERPTFRLKLDEGEDRIWFQRFLKQFDLLWEEACPVDLGVKEPSDICN